MTKLDAMRVFVQVARSGSLVSASRALNLSPSAVTRSLSELEKELGVSLLVRSTRHVRLTDSGEAYLQDAARILDDIAEVEMLVSGHHAPRGELTIAAPEMLGQLHIAPIVAKYLAKYPDVKVNLVHHDGDRLSTSDRADVDVRIGYASEQQAQGAIETVGCVEQILCASPAYLAEYGEPARLADLETHHLISTIPFQAGSAQTWAFKHNQFVRVCPRLSADDDGAAIAAAKAGGGIARLMSYQVQEELSSGQLVRVLASHEPAGLPVQVTRQLHDEVSHTVSCFCEMARAHFGFETGRQVATTH